MVEFDTAPFGIIGLETALPLCYTELVAKGVITLPHLIRLLTTGPADVLGFKNYSLAEGNPADITIIDPACKWVIDKNQFKSKSRNTPFDGWEVQSKVVMTIVNGKIVYQA